MYGTNFSSLSVSVQPYWCDTSLKAIPLLNPWNKGQFPYGPGASESPTLMSVRNRELQMFGRFTGIDECTNGADTYRTRGAFNQSAWPGPISVCVRVLVAMHAAADNGRGIPRSRIYTLQIADSLGQRAKERLRILGSAPLGSARRGCSLLFHVG